MRTITIVLLLLERAAWIGFTPGRGEGGKSGGLGTAGLWSLAFAVGVPAALLGHPSAGEAWAGLAVLAAGVVLRIASLRRLGRFFSELIVLREDHRLVRDGPYRVLRHPLHVGLVLMALGLALLGGGGWRFAAPALAALAQRLQRFQRVAQPSATAALARCGSGVQAARSAPSTSTTAAPGFAWKSRAATPAT